MKQLLLFEFQIELRKRSIATSLLLYLLSLVVINYFSIGIQGVMGTPGVWSALFWMVLLTMAVSTIAKSFRIEKSRQDIYFYSLVSPEQLILSKIIYGSILGIAVSTTGFLFFSILMSNPIQNIPLFLLTLVLSSIGFAASLSVLSAISSKTTNSGVIMAVMSFPVTIGILLMSIKITKNAIDGLAWSASADELLILLAISLISGAVSWLLFPYVWRS